jgi:chromosome partitioning protein
MNKNEAGAANIFCIANQKGGVGKTTTAINLAAALAELRKRVLLIDLDPQGNATMGSGVDKNKLEGNIYQVLLGQATIAQVRQRSESGGYDVLPANRELSGAEIDLIEMDEREQQLKSAIDSVRDDYEYILIDCPPTLSLLTLNGLASAHGVIIPMQCEYFALEGLSDLVNTIKRVHRNINPELQLIGLLRVMFDTRVTLQQQVSDQIQTHFGDKVFETIVPRNVRLAEAPSYGVPGTVYDKSSRGAKAYIDFGNELVRRVKKEALLARARIPGMRNA